MRDKNFDYGVFDSPEFKALEAFILNTHTLYTNKLANNKVFAPDNTEYIYSQWLENQGIRTGLKIWLSLINFIRVFHKRRRFNREFISVIQGVLQGLTLPLKWLKYRQKENRETSESTEVKEVNNRVDPNLVVEVLLKE